jgi:uncharacterized membrane protein YwzB
MLTQDNLIVLTHIDVPSEPHVFPHVLMGCVRWWSLQEQATADLGQER